MVCDFLIVLLYGLIFQVLLTLLIHPSTSVLSIPGNRHTLNIVWIWRSVDAVVRIDALNLVSAGTVDNWQHVSLTLVFTQDRCLIVNTWYKILIELTHWKVNFASI